MPTGAPPADVAGVKKRRRAKRLTAPKRTKRPVAELGVQKIHMLLQQQPDEEPEEEEVDEDLDEEDEEDEDEDDTPPTPPGPSPQQPARASSMQQYALARTAERNFVCPEAGCGMAYGSSAGLYQHKRAKHPWLINRRDPHQTSHLGERRFVCESAGCDKAYTTSMGLYQHKRTKHPWLIKQRERGYTRPSYRAAHSEAEQRAYGMSM